MWKSKKRSHDSICILERKIHISCASWHRWPHTRLPLIGSFWPVMENAFSTLSELASAWHQNRGRQRPSAAAQGAEKAGDSAWHSCRCSCSWDTDGVDLGRPRWRPGSLPNPLSFSVQQTFLSLLLLAVNVHPGGRLETLPALFSSTDENGDRMSNSVVSTATSQPILMRHRVIFT